MPTVSFNQHFPGYEILGELGRSNARVLKARNQFTGELVAIKHFSLNTDHETMVRFQRESGIMTAVNHPNIVKVKELHLDADLPYIVMELVEGGDLRALLKEKGSLDVSTTIRLGLQMAQAFKAIHEQGIIHRDIKPENIMYRYLASGEMHFLLTDFGVAKLREQSNTVTGTSLMTYEYASPEQFDNPKSVAPSTDYYSLGVVMYECLSGHVPFPLLEGRVHTLIKQVMDAPPPTFFLPAAAPLPKSMEKLVIKLLAKKESDRVKDPVTLMRLLKHIEIEQLGGEPALYEPVTPIPVSTATPVSQASATARVISKPVPSSIIKPARKKSNIALGLAVSFAVVLAIVLIIIIVKEKNKDDNNSDPQSNSSITDSIASDAAIVPADTISNYNDSIGNASLKNTAAEPLIRLHNGVYEERFANNDNGWPEVKTSETEMGIVDEAYRIKGISDAIHHRILKDFSLDMNKDFSVSLYTRWISGITDNGFGLYYCSDQVTASYYCFLISENGNYTIQHKKTSGDWEVVKEWTASNNINRSGRWNLLKIDKQDNTLFFYINNVYVEQLPFTGEFGTAFGPVASAAQTVDFDDLVIKSGN
jgi:serine/threonine protein kinase